MNKTLYTLFLLLYGISISAQSPYCSFDQVHQDLMKNDSGYSDRVHQLDELIYYRVKNGGIDIRSDYSVPVVVHIITPPGTPIGTANNLTDAQVEAGLELLNQAFANAGLFNTPDGVDVGIRFCLAKRTPGGQPTNGITRHESILVNDAMCGQGTNQTNDAAIKQIVNWNCKDYLNIWLVTDLYNDNFGCSLAGFAYFPGAPCSIDGIIQESRYWITVPGTTVTAHEVGHYFGLHHTFNGGCKNDDCLIDGDRVCDTPPDGSASFAPCNTNSCHSDTPDLPDDNTNYMDYSSCQPVHFTQGQKERMISGLQVGRASLLASLGCLPVANINASLTNVDATQCNDELCIQINVKNTGLYDINTLEIQYILNNGTPQTYNWSGLILKNEEKSINVPCLITGTPTIQTIVKINAVNGSADELILDNEFITNDINSINFISDFNSISDALTVSFINTSTGNSTYHWDFGDGNVSTLESPTHTYIAPGSYSVILTTFGQCGQSSITKVIQVSGQCSDPVLKLHFNNNFNDESNYHQVVSIGNTPVLTTDRFGNANSAALFGGYYDRDWLQIHNSNSLQFDKQMSLSLWFKQCDFSGMDGWGSFVPHGYHILFGKAGDGISVRPGFYSGTYTDNNNLMHVNFNNVYEKDMNVDSTFTCFDNCEWIHYMVVVDNNEVRMYFNGKLTKTIKSEIINFNEANNEDFWVGRMGGGAVWYPFNGVIDDIELYRCALTQENITELYGNYRDALFDPITLNIDSLRFEYLSCSTNTNNSLIIYAPSGDQYEYSIDHGETWQSNNNFNNLTVGSYRVLVRNKCAVFDTTIFIQLSPILRDSLIRLESVSCDKKGLVVVQALGGSPPYQYQLSSLPVQTTGVFSDLNAGDFTLTITDSKGCKIEKQIHIGGLSNNYSAIIDSSKLSLSCTDTLTYIKASLMPTNNAVYYYLDNERENNHGFFEELSLGHHTISVKDEFGCLTDTLDFEVVDHRKKYIDSLALGLCPGDTIYHNQVPYFDPGIYQEVLTASNGCDSILQITISQYPKAHAGEPSEMLDFCNNEDISVDLYTLLEHEDSGGKWTLVQGEVSNYASDQDRYKIQNAPEGHYIFRYKIDGLADCVSDSVDVSFNVFDSPKKLEVIGDTVFNCLDKAIVQLATDVLQGNIKKIDWYDSQHDLLFSGELDSDLTGINSPRYYVKLWDQNDCTIEQKFSIKIDYSFPYFAPNVFSPNHDGVNDVFKIFFGNQVDRVNTFRVFDRWGALMCEQHDIDPDASIFGWDGTYAGKEMNPGAYVWYAEFLGCDGQVVQVKGDVTVVR